MPSIPKQPNPSFHLTTTVLRAPGQAASGPPWGTQQVEARECRATLRCPGPSRGTVSWDPGPELGIQERLQGLTLSPGKADPWRKAKRPRIQGEQRQGSQGNQLPHSWPGAAGVGWSEGVVTTVSLSPRGHAGRETGS